MESFFVENGSCPFCGKEINYSTAKANVFESIPCKCNVTKFLNRYDRKCKKAGLTIPSGYFEFASPTMEDARKIAGFPDCIRATAEKAIAEKHFLPALMELYNCMNVLYNLPELRQMETLPAEYGGKFFPIAFAELQKLLAEDA